MTTALSLPSGHDIGSARPPSSPIEGLARWCVGLAAATATLSVFASVAGLAAATAVYREETPVLADAATAQDLVGLVVVAPLLLLLATATARGSSRCWLCLLGALSFNAYNYAIYAFSVHFGPLFLVWVAVLGLSLFALITGIAALEAQVIRALFAEAPARVAGCFLVSMAVLFALVWLNEVVPDLAAGRPSTSAADWNLPTNPVHVLDLAFFLPAVAISGVLLLRRHWLGYATAAGQLTFLLLTCLPILLTPFVATVRGHTSEWSVTAPIGVIAVAAVVVLWQFLRPLAGSPADDGPTP